MRTLTVKQKRLLAKYWDKYQCYNLDSTIVRQLEQINDHETIIQNANRFLWDYGSRASRWITLPSELETLIRTWK